MGWRGRAKKPPVSPT